MISSGLEARDILPQCIFAHKKHKLLSVSYHSSHIKEIEFYNSDIKICLKLLTCNNLGRIMPITDINMYLLIVAKDII